MSGSFKCSRLVEELKLGDSPITKMIRELAGGSILTEFGLPLTFTQDRALTAVQLLFAWLEMQPSGTVPLPPEMQFLGWSSRASYIDINTLSYCRAYLGEKTKRINSDALLALSDLAQQEFCLAYPHPDEPVNQAIRSPILLVKEKGRQQDSYPSHLRIIFSPVLLHGAEGLDHRYIRKPTDLYAGIDLALGPGRGKRPPQLPRLASWIAIQRRNLILVGSEKLGRQLRSHDVISGHTKRFVRTISGYLEVLKSANIVRSFVAPCQATGGKWKIVRYPPPKL
jgi:hypothetical protein